MGKKLFLLAAAAICIPTAAANAGPGVTDARSVYEVGSASSARIAMPRSS